MQRQEKNKTFRLYKKFIIGVALSCKESFVLFYPCSLSLEKLLNFKGKKCNATQSPKCILIREKNIFQSEYTCDGNVEAMFLKNNLTHPDEIFFKAYAFHDDSQFTIRKHVVRT